MCDIWFDWDLQFLTYACLSVNDSNTYTLVLGYILGSTQWLTTGKNEYSQQATAVKVIGW